jgi:hypothetical protein
VTFVELPDIYAAAGRALQDVFDGLISTDSIVNFLPMHGDLCWRIDSDTDFIPSDFDDRNSYVIVNTDRLVLLSAEH